MQALQTRFLELFLYEGAGCFISVTHRQCSSPREENNGVSEQLTNREIQHVAPTQIYNGGSTGRLRCNFAGGFKDVWAHDCAAYGRWRHNHIGHCGEV